MESARAAFNCKIVVVDVVVVVVVVHTLTCCEGPARFMFHVFAAATARPPTLTYHNNPGPATAHPHPSHQPLTKITAQTDDWPCPRHAARRALPFRFIKLQPAPLRCLGHTYGCFKDGAATTLLFSNAAGDQQFGISGHVVTCRDENGKPQPLEVLLSRSLGS